MIQATIRMIIAPHRRGEALEILIAAAERTRIQPGCLSARIYRDEQQEGVFMIEDVWSCQEDLDSHLRSENYRQVLLVAEMALEPPQINFKTISQSVGMEIIERARGVTLNNQGGNH